MRCHETCDHACYIVSIVKVDTAGTFSGILQLRYWFEYKFQKYLPADKVENVSIISLKTYLPVHENDSHSFISFQLPTNWILYNFPMSIVCKKGTVGLVPNNWNFRSVFLEVFKLLTELIPLFLHVIAYIRTRYVTGYNFFQKQPPNYWRNKLGKSQQFGPRVLWEAFMSSA